MRVKTRVVKEVVLAPGEYHIKELVFGLDFIVVEAGELAGKTLPIWGGYYTIDYSEQVPLRLIYEELRSWRTLWAWRQSITVSDGMRTSPVTEQAPEEVPISIEWHGSPPESLKR